MDLLSQLHFAHPMWLWIGVAIPLAWAVFIFFYQIYHSHHQLEKFIDNHLLPYLLINQAQRKSSRRKTMLFWSLAWACLTLALAGPRWSFREVETFSQDQTLVLLLDLSESMNAKDIKPSRLIRGKQKIEDLLNISKGVKIGLIAFAADPHMITPVTDDKETIRHLLPSLTTDLIYVQGSRLSPALEMASAMLEAEPGNNKALLVLSDGGFEDSTAIITAKKLAEKGVVIHVMGVGTLEGAPLYHDRSQKNQFPIITKLEKERLSEISKAGNGFYLEAHYSDHAEASILKELQKRAEAQENIGKKNQFWEERFYLLILPALPIILWWFRRGYIFAAILILFTPLSGLEAHFLSDSFKNSEEHGKQAFEEGDYEAAASVFKDPYRKGVACYKAKNFVEAEKMFRQSSRLDVACNAGYNLGNALVQQNKLKEAIEVYEDVLKSWPMHTKTKENLELVKKMLEQEKQDSQSNSDRQNEKTEENPESKENDKKKDSSQDKSPNSKNNQQQQNKDNSHQQDSGKQENDDKADSKNSGDSGAEPEQQNEMKEESRSPEENQNSNGQQQQKERQKGMNDTGDEQKEASGTQVSKSQKDQDADQWLNRIANDPKKFLKNKFYIESKKKGTKEGIDPW